MKAVVKRPFRDINICSIRSVLHKCFFMISLPSLYYLFVECTKSVVLISKWIKLKIINKDSGEIFDKVKNKEQLHVA